MNIRVRIHREKIRSAVQRGAERGIPEAMEILKGASQQQVPVLTGALRDSCAVSAEGLSGSVSYSAPYAVRVHEDLSAHHRTGGAKFLENAAADAENGRRMAEALCRCVRREL